MATTNVVNGGDPSAEGPLKDLIALAKKDKLRTLSLSQEIISGLSRQIIGIENELSTVARMQKFKSSHVCSPPSLCHLTSSSFFPLPSLFLWKDSKSSGTPQEALAELFESVHEIKLRSAKANEAMISILNDQQKIDFAKARILSSSTSSLAEIITLQCVYDELEAEVSGQDESEDSKDIYEEESQLSFPHSPLR